MRLAPHGAKRIGKHTLQIKLTHGIRRFVDKGCEEGYIGGQCWNYCGYEPNLHLHFLNQEAEDLFTGVLLDDRTGKILPGGNTVIFSPDRQSYLSISQWDGKEFSDWKLYTIHGTLLWAGESGIVNKKDEIQAEFSYPTWSSSGELLTEYTDSGTTVRLKLTRRTNGHWGWIRRDQSTKQVRPATNVPPG